MICWDGVMGYSLMLQNDMAIQPFVITDMKM